MMMMICIRSVVEIFTCKCCDVRNVQPAAHCTVLYVCLNVTEDVRLIVVVSRCGL